MIRNWMRFDDRRRVLRGVRSLRHQVFDDFWLNSIPNLPDDVFAFNRNAVEKIKRAAQPSFDRRLVRRQRGRAPGAAQRVAARGCQGLRRRRTAGTSPFRAEYGFSGSGPWVNAHPIWYFTAHPLGYGDHKLDGWGFRTEIGSAVFTNYESYKKFMPEPERWPASPEMLDKHFFGNSAGNARPTRYFAAVEYNYGQGPRARRISAARRSCSTSRSTRRCTRGGSTTCGTTLRAS